MKCRILTPELLDELPHDDPEAIRSRRDLRRINALMGSLRWIEARVAERAGVKPEIRVVEPGAGDGVLARRICERFPALRYMAIDLAPPPPGLPPNLEWRQGDLFDLLPDAGGDILVANLFLHHFTDEQLASLGQMMSGFETIICSEPARRVHLQCLSRILYVSGINHVTRHDMHASIAAGFVREELPRVLQLNAPPWEVHERETLLGAIRMIASRR